MAPSIESYKSHAYSCVGINTADLRNISGDMGKAERQNSYAVVTVVDEKHVRIEYMRGNANHGNSFVTCECECLKGVRVHNGAQFVMPMWPSWSKNMGIEWLAILPDDATLQVWCFNKDKKIMPCTYDLSTRPVANVSKDFPMRQPVEGVPKDAFDDLAAKLMERGEVISDLNERIEIMTTEHKEERADLLVKIDMLTTERDMLKRDNDQLKTSLSNGDSFSDEYDTMELAYENKCKQCDELAALVAELNSKLASIESENAELRTAWQSLANAAYGEGGFLMPKDEPTETVDEPQPEPAPTLKPLPDPAPVKTPQHPKFWVPSGCTESEPTKAKNVWLEGPMDLIEAHEDELMACGWKLAAQRKARGIAYMWRKAC